MVQDPSISTNFAMNTEAHKFFSITILDKNTLYSSYMSYVKGGGLFIPNKASVKMGERINLLLKLPESSDAFMLKTVVSWISSGKRKGFGLQMLPSEHASRAQAAIENVLGTSIKSGNPTYTM